MAFTTTKEITDVSGKKYVTGSYTNDGGSIGGEIDTGLSRVEFMSLQPKGAVVSANQPVVDETLPLTGSKVTIVTGSNEIGYWFAVGT